MGEHAKDTAAVTRNIVSTPLPNAPLATGPAVPPAAVGAASPGACGGRRGTMVALIARRLVQRPLPPHL